jgi:hypothetical protein
MKNRIHGGYFMYTDNQIDVLGIVQTTVKRHGVKALADRLAVRPQTLYADVDPNSIGRRTNKLGLLDWLVVLEETGDLSSLCAVNQAFDRITLPVPRPAEELTEKSWVAFCATIAKESGEAVARLAESILDGHMGDGELERCEKETWDALEAFAGLYLAIQNCKDHRQNRG